MENNEAQRQAAEKDGALFARLLMRHERQMRALVCAMLPGTSEVDDILQETSVALWRNFEDYDSERPFAPWALTFTRLQTLAHLEKKGRRDARLSRETLDDIADHFLAMSENGTGLPGQESRLAALEQCLDQLDPLERTLLRKRYTEGYTVKELAADPAFEGNLEALYKRFARLNRRLLRCVKTRLRRQQHLGDKP